MGRPGPEADIQAGILQFLELHRVCHSVTNAERVWSKSGIPRPSKVRRGWPDITCCYRGRFVALEVKSPQGQQSPAQILCEKKIKANGGFYFVVRSTDATRKAFMEVNRCLGPVTK